MQVVPGRSIRGIEFDPDFAREAATRPDMMINGISIHWIGKRHWLGAALIALFLPRYRHLFRA